MKKLLITGTEYTPDVKLDPDENHITLSGVSRPENAALFYQKIFNWVNNFQLVVKKREFTEFKITFKLDYCNSPSQKHILLIIEKFLEYEKIGLSLTVDWYSNKGDEKMLEDGEDIAEALGIHFNFKQLC